MDVRHRIKYLLNVPANKYLTDHQIRYFQRLIICVAKPTDIYKLASLVGIKEIQNNRYRSQLSAILLFEPFK